MREISPPLVIAHRGASAAFRENTVEAFAGAATLGADWVELDVRRTADGEVVVHHDPTIAAVGSASLVIADASSSALPSWVPTLAAALTACEQPGRRSGRPLGVNVEIKSAPDEAGFDPGYGIAPPVVALVRAHLRLDRTLVSSFDPGALAAVAAVDPEVPTALLAFDLSDPERVLARAQRLGCAAVNPWDGFVTAELVAAAHERGLAVHVWTVDGPDRMAELCGFGVDGIITNVPDVCAAVVDGSDAVDG